MLQYSASLRVTVSGNLLCRVHALKLVTTRGMLTKQNVLGYAGHGQLNEGSVTNRQYTGDLPGRRLKSDFVVKISLQFFLGGARDSRRPLFPCERLQNPDFLSHLTRGPYRLLRESIPIALNTNLPRPWVLGTFLTMLLHCSVNILLKMMMCDMLPC